jgi:hypothetical protein
MRLATVLALVLWTCLLGCGQRDREPAGKKDPFRGMKKPTERFNTDPRSNR